MSNLSDDNIALTKKTQFIHIGDKVWQIDGGDFVCMDDINLNDLVRVLNSGSVVKKDSYYTTITLDAFEVGIIEQALWNYYNTLSLQWKGVDQLWFDRKICLDKWSKNKHKRAVLKKKNMDIAKRVIKKLENRGMEDIAECNDKEQESD